MSYFIPLVLIIVPLAIAGLTAPQGLAGARRGRATRRLCRETLAAFAPVNVPTRPTARRILAGHDDHHE
jgi:hypothetical protein